MVVVVVVGGGEGSWLEEVMVERRNDVWAKVVGGQVGEKRWFRSKIGEV